MTELGMQSILKPGLRRFGDLLPYSRQVYSSCFSFLKIWPLGSWQTLIDLQTSLSSCATIFIRSGLCGVSLVKSRPGGAHFKPNEFGFLSGPPLSVTFWSARRLLPTKCVYFADDGADGLGLRSRKPWGLGLHPPEERKESEMGPKGNSEDLRDFSFSESLKRKKNYHYIHGR
ncbi:hypothetical protein NPIL_268061 [Nephila pilipes]|uniref:Uncharacterized protein n=1 Tax=Nephila pilipes TaxID=299642 RepID=A0A8X6UIT0_NEPPI|nr:hypothetical protein NPIL_268061 [Nephila pilipes]